jgi:phage terminase large subunit-like protein
VKHIRHPSDEAKQDQKHTYDEAHGDRVIRFLETYLFLEDGRPFQVLPWMRDLIHSWYSWIRPDGLRSTKIGLLSCGRKQGKSILTYGLTCFHLVADGTQSPSCVSCAVDREQASQIYKWLAFARDRNPKLRNALVPVDSQKIMRYPARNGTYKSLTSDHGGGKLGTGHTFVINDELAFHSKDNVYTALKNSTDARPNSMQVITSTAGWNTNGAFYKLVQYARKVLDGSVIDTTFQPWIYEVPHDADLDDERNWYLANPSLGITQSVEDFRNQWQREKQDLTTKLAFQRLKFNQWTDSEDGWISADDWDACKGTVTLDKTTPVIVGIDIGATRDLTALSVVGNVAGKVHVKSWGFVPKGYMDTRDNANLTQYEGFVKAGNLTITPGTVTNPEIIRAFLDKLLAEYKVQAVVFDKWQATDLQNYVEKKGVKWFNFPQTHSYFHSPCLELEKLVGRKKLVHDGNALLRWQVGHTSLHRDGKGYTKPQTSKPENKKDNLISVLMALSHVLLAGDGGPKRSVYDRQGICVV